MRVLAFAAVAGFGAVACFGSTAPTYSFAGEWQGSLFQLANVRVIGNAVAGTFVIPFDGITTGPCQVNSTITEPMTGRVSGTLVTLQIAQYPSGCGEVPASTWTGHFRDASTVLGTWTTGVHSVPDSLVKTTAAIQ